MRWKVKDNIQEFKKTFGKFPYLSKRTMVVLASMNFGRKIVQVAESSLWLSRSVSNIEAIYKGKIEGY